MTHVEIRHVDNLKRPGYDWVLRWRTATMPAPAFDYYRTREEAETARTQLLAPPVARPYTIADSNARQDAYWRRVGGHD